MEYETAIKKYLWIFFQKYGFIREIEPFHLRMKDIIIQMTATSGLTVSHSINPIFQYIFDFLVKRSIRSISKIVAFGAQKIQTSSLRSRCTNNEWLFGVYFGTVASLGYFSSKMGRKPPLRSMVSITVPWSTNFCLQNWREWYGHLVSTGRRHLPHSQRNVKDKCYANHPETIEVLKHEIEFAIHGIEVI